VKDLLMTINRPGTSSDSPKAKDSPAQPDTGADAASPPPHGASALRLGPLGRTDLLEQPGDDVRPLRLRQPGQNSPAGISTQSS
jgi:hypothetical protein